MLEKSEAQPERKTVLVRERHQLLRVPPCVMRQAGGRLDRTHLAQHKGHRERVVEPAGFRKRLVHACASLIEVAQIGHRPEFFAAFCSSALRSLVAVSSDLSGCSCVLKVLFSKPSLARSRSNAVSR